MKLHVIPVQNVFEKSEKPEVIFSVSSERVAGLTACPELVEHGYAQVMTIPPNVKHQDLFLRLQREAREAGRGLWR